MVAMCGLARQWHYFVNVWDRQLPLVQTEDLLTPLPLCSYVWIFLLLYLVNVVSWLALPFQSPVMLAPWQYIVNLLVERAQFNMYYYRPTSSSIHHRHRDNIGIPSHIPCLLLWLWWQIFLSPACSPSSKWLLGFPAHTTLLEIYQYQQVHFTTESCNFDWDYLVLVAILQSKPLGLY